MPETTEQLQDTEPLGEQIDALLKNIDASAAAVRAELGEEPAAVQEPEAVVGAEPTAPASTGEPVSPTDSILGEVSAEIGGRSEGPEVSEVAPSAREPETEPVPVAPPSEVPDPAGLDSLADWTAAETAAAEARPAARIEDVMEAVETELEFVAPEAFEAVPAPTSAKPGTEVRAEMTGPTSPAPAAFATADTSAADATPRTISELDDALAAEAGEAVERAITDAANRVETREPELAPTPSAALITERSGPAPITVAPRGSAPAQTAASASGSPAGSLSAARSIASRLGPALGGLLAPVAKLGARVPEATRQTIGYLAVMTLFFGVVLWGIVLLRKPALPSPIAAVPLVKEGQTPPARFEATSAAERTAAAAKQKADTEKRRNGGDWHGKSAGAKPGAGAGKGDAKGAKDPKKADAESGGH